MADWYLVATETAIHNHDPDRYEGRTWNELTLVEQEAAITVAADQIGEVPV